MSWVAFFFLVAIALIGHGYIWIGPINRLHAWAGPRVLVDQLSNLCLVAFVALPLPVAWDLWNLESQELYRYWASSGWLPRYAQLCVIWGIGKIIFDWFDQRKVDSPRNLLSWQQRWVEIPETPPGHGFYTQLLTAIPGNQILRLSIDKKRLAVTSLPDKLEGFKIVHISDVHMTGRIDKRWFEIIAAEVNRLEADAIAITGDLVENKTCWPWLADSLAKLRAKQGVYFILGNHDFFVDANQTRQLLSEAGLVCLSKQSHKTKWNGTQVFLSGNERPWGIDSLDDSKPEQPNSAEQFHLSLIHTPDQFGWACQNQANLVLAGHTHGGQIRLPILGAVACPSLHGTHYACGVFRQGDTVMHVSRGLSGDVPIRWNCRPEIAHLRLCAPKPPPRSTARRHGAVVVSPSRQSTTGMGRLRTEPAAR
jgi:predicted MPP superfamily phosphohydrolase